MDTEQPPRKHNRALSKVLTVLLIVAIVAFVGCLLLKWFWICNIGVSGESMLPNYKGYESDRDVVWVNKSIQPKRGDVVVFYVNNVNHFLGEFATGVDVQHGGKYEKYIKRVVALSGDKIWWEKASNKDDEKRCVLKIKTADGAILSENDGNNVYYRHGQQAQFYTTSFGSDLSTVPYFLIPSDGNTLFKYNSEQNALVIAEGYMFVMGDNRYNSADSRGELGQVPIVNVYGVVINP